MTDGSADDLLLPAGTRLIHIGPPKTGTSAIQTAFHKAREQVATHGVHYAGSGTRPRKAVSALTGAGVPASARPPMRHWEALVREVEAAGDMRVCISNESFAAADDAAATRARDELGGVRSHVVSTVRRLDALLPSQWQQRVRKQRGAMSYDEWLRVVLGDDRDDPNWQHFWRLHDLEATCARWRAGGDDPRMTLIVADESDRRHLPRVFERMFGLPDGILVPFSDQTNRSLSYNEAEFVRSLDRHAAEAGWPADIYPALVKSAVARSVRRVAKDPDDMAITTPAWAEDQIEDINGRRMEFLRGVDLPVVGDVDNLRRPAGRAGGEGEEVLPDRVTIELAARAVRAAVDAVLTRAEERTESDD